MFGRRILDGLLIVFVLGVDCKVKVWVEWFDMVSGYVD